MLVHNFLWLAPCARKRMNYVCDKQTFLGPKNSKPIHQIRQHRETGVEEIKMFSSYLAFSTEKGKTYDCA